MDKATIYNEKYMPSIKRLGTIFGILGVIASFLPPLCLAIVYDLMPSTKALLTAFISIASAVGVVWFVEPISYFPVVGVPGTFLCCLSGNISNMRVPCAAVAQTSAGVEAGTEEGSIIGTLGISVSIIINIIILSIGVIGGQKILSAMPPVVTETLNFLLPALFGALFVQFAMMNKKLAPIALLIGLGFNIGLKMGIFAFLPAANNWLGTLGTIFLTLAIGVTMHKKATKA